MSILNKANNWVQGKINSIPDSITKIQPISNLAAAATQTHRVVPEEPVMVAEVRAEREDLAPAGRAAGVDGGRGERDEAIPVRRRVGALVPRGGRQHAAEGPPPARPARALVGEGDDGEAEAGVPDGTGDEEELRGLRETRDAGRRETRWR